MDSHKRDKTMRQLLELTRDPEVEGMVRKLFAQNPDGSTEIPETKTLGRSTVEAYAFFLTSGVYVVLSAFGISVNFWAGSLVLAVMAYCAIDLLWNLSITIHRPRTLKVIGTIIIVVAIADLMRAGWVSTHRKPDASDNAALVDLFVQKVRDVVATLQPPKPATTNQASTTQPINPNKPFTADIGPILYSRDRATAWVALTSNQSAEPKQVFPAQVSAEMIFTNGDHAVLIATYRIEAQTQTGKWVRLLRLDSTGKKPFMLSTDRPVKEALPTALLVNLPLFDERIYDRPLSPHEATKGWVFFQFPQSPKSVSYTGKLRVVVTDTAGERFISAEIPGRSTLPNDSPQAAGIQAVQRIDLSAFQITYLDD
jgi:hypothetical protein